MFVPNISTHISGENITFIDFSENSRYPAECLIAFNPELYQIHLEELDALENDLIFRYNDFADIHKDPHLLENGVIHFTPIYPDDMNNTLKTILAHAIKTEIRDFILTHSIRPH